MKNLPFGHTPFTGGDAPMVKGISRQVILVESPDTQLFEQAIFILKDNQKEISNELLLKEAKRILNTPQRKLSFRGPVWACGGAVLTGIIWLFTIFL